MEYSGIVYRADINSKTSSKFVNGFYKCKPGIDIKKLLDEIRAFIVEEYSVEQENVDITMFNWI